MEWHIGSVSDQYLANEQRRKLRKLLRKVQAMQQCVVPCKSVFRFEEDLKHMTSSCARIAACGTMFKLMLGTHCYVAK